MSRGHRLRGGRSRPRPPAASRRGVCRRRRAPAPDLKEVSLSEGRQQRGAGQVVRMLPSSRFAQKKVGLKERLGGMQSPREASECMGKPGHIADVRAQSRGAERGASGTDRTPLFRSPTLWLDGLRRGAGHGAGMAGGPVAADGAYCSRGETQGIRSQWRESRRALREKGGKVGAHGLRRIRRQPPLAKRLAGDADWLWTCTPWSSRRRAWGPETDEREETAEIFGLGLNSY
jgi:hypothetical protein